MTELETERRLALALARADREQAERAYRAAESILQDAQRMTRERFDNLRAAREREIALTDRAR